MAKSARIPRGYTRSGINVQEISEGQRGHLRNAGTSPAPFLPVLEEDKSRNDGIVIKAGTIVAVQVFQGVPYLVPANGGSAQDITYTQLDIDLGVTEDYENPGTFISATKTVTGALAANRPIGVAPTNYYQSTYEDAYVNYTMQPSVAVLFDYLLEYPVLTANDANGAVAAGHLVKPDANGNWSLFVPATDDVDQVIGRCIVRESIAVEDNLDKVATVKGLSLSGTGTSGIPRHLDVPISSGSSTKASEKVRIQITLA